jgi:stage V sporulation protein AD
VASTFIEGGVAQKVVACTSSHFCTAERQFRFPLEYGGQRTPTAQWTATASGAAVLQNGDVPPFVRAITVGTIEDLGVTDANNMGAAMAPAAAMTIKHFFEDTGKKPEEFDLIITGDLGKVGSSLLADLLRRDGIDLGDRQSDCGLLLYDLEKQDVHAGGSGCGCSASVLCGHLLPQMREGKLHNILFIATGALMSPTVVQQGESIASIAHLVCLSTQKSGGVF